MLEKTLTDQIGAIGKQLRVIETKLDDKASNVRVEAVEKRAAALEERVLKIELSEAGTTAVGKLKTVVFTTLCGGLVGTLFYIAASGVHL